MKIENVMLHMYEDTNSVKYTTACRGGHMLWLHFEMLGQTYILSFRADKFPSISYGYVTTLI